MTLDVIVSQYVAAFVQWGFLMAFLFSIVTTINKQDKALTYLSLIMFISYSASVFVDINTVTFFDFFLFDIFTSAIIVLVGRYITKMIAYYYLLIGLTINASFFIAMYYDINLQGNDEYWWFWSVYSIGVNTIDLIMISVLFINKDFLGLISFKKSLFAIINGVINKFRGINT
jgi:hypothetical protein